MAFAALSLSVPIKPDDLPLPPEVNNSPSLTAPTTPASQNTTANNPSPSAKADDNPTPSFLLKPVAPLRCFQSEDSDDEAPINADIRSDFLSKNAPPRRSAILMTPHLSYNRPETLALNHTIPTTSPLFPFATLHNAVRAVLIDLYDIVDGLKRAIHNVRTEPHLAAFFRWWGAALSFLRAATAAYELVLQPSVGSIVREDVLVPGCVAVEKVAVVGRTVKSLQVPFATVAEQLARRAPDESVAALIRCLDVVGGLTSFFAQVEGELAPMVTEEGLRGLGLEEGLVECLRKEGTALQGRRLHLHVVARGMAEGDVAAWQRRAMRPWTRVRFWAGAARFREGYVTVVHELSSL